jgi:hypothetical protein
MQFTHLVQQSISLFAPLKKDLAYLDPGTGSFLLQLLLATFLGGLFMVKVFWKRIKDFFRRLFKRDQQDAQPGNVQPENVQPEKEQQSNDEPK